MTTFPLKLKGLHWPTPKKRRRSLGSEYEGLVGRLMSSASSAGLAPVVGVTACGPGEGVTTVATNLGAAAGRTLTGHTLLVDANLDRPEVEGLFGLSDMPGLVNVLADEERFKESVQPTQVPRLSVMGPGTGAAGAGFYKPETWERFVAMVRGPFDLVIVDLPPVPRMASQYALGKALDGVFFVIRAERTRTKAALRYRDQLTRVNPRILGVILNRRKTYVPNWLYKRI